MAKRRLITFDWALKRLLRSKANFIILEGFLSELLHDDITILEILESESNRETQLHKLNQVDLKVKNRKNEIIVIEVQYDREYDYFHRILLGVSKVITEHLYKAETYDRVVKVISISILYFDLGQGGDYIYHGTTNFHGIHDNKPLELSHKQKQMFSKEKVADIYPEYYLLKINQFDDNAKDSLDEWIYFLKNEEIKDEFQAQGLRQAKETLDILRLSEEDRHAYELYLETVRYQSSMFKSSYGDGKLDGIKEGRTKGIKEGRTKGIKEGRTKGIKEGRTKGIKEGRMEGEKNKARHIAAQLLDILDDAVIADKTGLTLAEVQQLHT